MSQQNQEAKKIQDYLIQYFTAQLKDKAASELQNILGKIARSLGMSAFSNLITGNFPGAALASAGTFYLKWLWFEGYFSANPGMNPYDPINEQDQYVEFLLYSWARGKPGYMYNDLRALGRTIHH